MRHNLTSAVRYWVDQLQTVPDPHESVKFMIQHLFSGNKLRPNHLSESQYRKLNLMCRQRMKRVPLQYILGEWNFRGLTLKMAPPVFIPRPETEMLVDLVLPHLNSGSRVLEIGCGSGAISLSLLKERPEISITAIDKSPFACDLTMSNAKKLGISNIKVLNHNLSSDGILGGNFNFDKFDVVVSNPPYVESSVIDGLQPEITRYEDLDALDGGPDGLKITKDIILNSSSSLLKDGGKLFLEVGIGQPAQISKWLDTSDLPLRFAKAYNDFTGRARFIECDKV